MKVIITLLGIGLLGAVVMPVAPGAGGLLILGSGLLMWLVAFTQYEKKKWEAWQAESEAQSSAPEQRQDDTPPAPASNGEEYTGAEASVYVAVLHQDSDVANAIEKHYLRPEYRKTMNGHDLTLEINE